LVVAVGCGSGEDDSGADLTRDEPIVGGTRTSQFESVGALVVDGQMHCTGTLIRPNEVLTAGHCVDGVDLTRMEFRLGRSIHEPSRIIRVTGSDLHPQYRRSPLENDIAVVFLEENAPAPPMRLIASFDSSFVGQELIFVGYGFADGVSKTGGGTKRVVNIPVASVAETTFRYATPDRNTCNGDSGGPAFLPSGNELLIVGVTSSGDRDCVFDGTDTRTDVYLSFLGLQVAPARFEGDSCGGETAMGRCAGSTVVFCEAGQVKSLNCNRCGFNEQKNFFDCLQ
jgi:secreted trypsin-like serine protease